MEELKARDLSRIDNYLQENYESSWNNSNILYIYDGAKGKDYGWEGIYKEDIDSFNKGWDYALNFAYKKGHDYQDLKRILDLKYQIKSKQLIINKSKNLETMAEKSTKKKNVRTNEKLEARGKKGIAFILLRDAYNAEARKHKKRSKETGNKEGHSFKGSDQLSGSVLPSAVFARAGKEGTEYWDIKESDPRFTSFVSAVKDAGTSGQLKDWGGKTAKAMNEFLAIKGERSARTGLSSSAQDSYLSGL